MEFRINKKEVKIMRKVRFYHDEKEFEEFRVTEEKFAELLGSLEEADDFEMEDDDYSYDPSVYGDEI